jgi:hypothetical protein
MMSYHWGFLTFSQPFLIKAAPCSNDGTATAEDKGFNLKAELMGSAAPFTWWQCYQTFYIGY